MKLDASRFESVQKILLFINWYFSQAWRMRNFIILKVGH